MCIRDRYMGGGDQRCRFTGTSRQGTPTKEVDYPSFKPSTEKKTLSSVKKSSQKLSIDVIEEGSLSECRDLRRQLEQRFRDERRMDALYKMYKNADPDRSRDVYQSVHKSVGRSTIIDPPPKDSKRRLSPERSEFRSYSPMRSVRSLHETKSNANLLKEPERAMTKRSGFHHPLGESKTQAKPPPGKKSSSPITRPQRRRSPLN
eukprot:TRINITY_DN10020_c0_g1_i2.p1 TRINITY_DN10020_c0_g1~~TRINITY_DN10020_c0_g1_i2.p1  ORF type:complete len:204 (-),score=45.90 TRINITY_DN10020_c0_g1_i2:89-700(-)